MWHDDTPQDKNKIKQKKFAWQSLEQTKHWISNYFWTAYFVPRSAAGLQDSPGRQLTYPIVANIQHFQFFAVTYPLRQVFQMISVNKQHNEVYQIIIHMILLHVHFLRSYPLRTLQ